MAILDEVYFSTHKPIGTDETVVEQRDRKPGPGMLLRAAKELNLDLPKSWMIGDQVFDVLADLNDECRSIRARTGFTYQGSLPFVESGYDTVMACRTSAGLLRFALR